MTEASDHKWRDKYLDILDQHEALERRYQEDVSLLQRVLLRTTVAADGQQPELDRALEALRGILREQPEPGRIKSVMSALDEALLKFDEQREHITGEIKASLQSLIIPLLAREPARPVKRKLRDLAQEVSRQRDLLHVYPSLLHQLARLQAQVLESHQATDPAKKAKPAGLMSRLLGKDEADTVPEEPQDESGKASQLNASQVDRALFELNPNASLRDSATVSENMRAIITELLLSVEAQNVEPARVQSLQKRLKAGITNADLLPVLEDVRDLIMAAYMAATRAFAEYLTDVNAELTEIYQVLDMAADASSDLEVASATMQADMMMEFEQLSHSTKEATDLNQLKSQVQNRIGNIRTALIKFRERSETKGQISQQLETLSERLKSMESEAERNRKILAEQRAKALTDPLTGVPNREAFNERAAVEVRRFHRYQNPLTLAIFDLDYFKKINDTLGHQAGDRVLQVLSHAISRRLRDVDFFGRYGGEEFIALLPETDAEQAYQCLDTIREAIARTEFNYRDQPVDISVSIGIAQFAGEDSVEKVFERADRALYEAKAAGRNQCKIASASAD